MPQETANPVSAAWMSQVIQTSGVTLLSSIKQSGKDPIPHVVEASVPLPTRSLLVS